MSGLGAKWRSKYGPWAVVTGASDGIGRAAAGVLAGSGLHVVLVARRQELLRELGTELVRKHGIEARVVPADLANPAGVTATLDAVTDLDVGLLVAAAGFGTSGAFTDADPVREVQMLEVNCRAVLTLSHAFSGRFRARGGGGVVLMSSIVGFQGVPGASHYAATKAYVQSLAEGMHFELRGHGVDVLASAPGPVHTGFGEVAGMRLSGAHGPETVAVATLKALGRRVTVRPGWRSKALHAALTLPRGLRVRIMRAVMRRMTRRRTVDG